MSAPDPLAAAKDFALQKLNSGRDCVVVVVRYVDPQERYEYERKSGHWSKLVSNGEQPETELQGCLRQRPRSVEKARLWILLPIWIVFGLMIILAGVFAYWLSSASKADLPLGAARAIGEAFPLMADTLFALTAFVFLLILLFHWLTAQLLRGADWARIVLIVILALSLLAASFDLLVALSTQAQSSFWELISSVVSLVLSVIPTVYLCRSDTSDWFRRIRLLKDKTLMKG